MYKYAIAVLVALLLCTVCACDKIKVPGNIAGRVLDEAGAPVGMISVELSDAATGKSVTQETTDDLGNYFFSKVDPGKYKIKTLWMGRTEMPNDTGEIKLGPGKTLNLTITVTRTKSE